MTTVSDPSRAPAQPFTGPVRKLQEVLKVPPDVVVLVHGVTQEDEWSLRLPGDTLVPRWNPFRRGPDLVPVTTGPVGLRIEIPDVVTHDGAEIRVVAVRVTVQLSEADAFGVVLDLARRFGPAFGSAVMAEIRGAVEASVRGALRMTPPEDLERLGFGTLLDQRWVPRSFLGGAVLRRALEVLDVDWPPPPLVTPRRAAGPEHPLPTPTPAADREAGTPELSMDVRLRRVWRGVSAIGVRGIAGAYGQGRAAVVVVAEREPSAYEFEQAREAFGALYGDADVVLAVATSGELETVVRAWLGAADHGHAQLVGVDVLRDGDLLRIRHDGALAEPGEGSRGRPGPDGPEAEALRRLLPHRRVELATVRTG